VSWSIVLVDGDNDAHLEQGLHQVGSALGHAIGELLDGDRLGHDDVADLLGLLAGLLMCPLLLFAGAAKRGERTGAGVAFVVERPGDGELAALAAMLVATAGRAGRLRDACGNMAVLGAGMAGAPVLVLLDGHGLRSGGLRRSVAGSLLGRHVFGALLRLVLGALLRLVLSATILLGAATFVVARRLRLLVLAPTRFLERGEPIFLGLAQQLLLALAAGGGVFGRTRGWLGHRRGLRRADDRLRGRNRLRLCRLDLARAAENAALLDLDHDGVRAAMAETLLHLARLDRALQAQGGARSEFRLVCRLAHSNPSLTSLMRAASASAEAAKFIRQTESPPQTQRTGL
jgi:hypothetical protein